MPQVGLLPLRFRTAEQADQALAFLRDGKPIPEYLLIWPDDPEYPGARFEIRPEKKVENSG